MNESNVVGNNETLIEVRDMCKNYGVTVALNHVSLSVKSGLICGLVGENGSGKSTLSSIIAGIQSTTSGHMFYKGKPWNPTNVLEAQENGIAMIVQETGTIDNVTVAENIFLGQEKMFTKGMFVNRASMFEEAQKLLISLGVKEFTADTPTYRLDMQERNLVEIAKALYWKPSLFIVDETTTALSHTGRTLLYNLMRSIAKQGGTVLFISHDLDELMEYCDVLTVLRDGDYIGTLEKSDYDEGLIKKMMVGRELEGDYYH